MAATKSTFLSRRALLLSAFLSLTSTLALPAGNTSSASSAQPSHAFPARSALTMKIQISADGVVIATGTLDNNDSARDFAALLPLNLLLKDYAATEKIADLPRALSVKGAPTAYKPLAADINYYAPWGNLAVFYKNGHLSSGLVRLGRIESGMDAILGAEASAVRIELVRP